MSIVIDVNIEDIPKNKTMKPFEMLEGAIALVKNHNPELKGMFTALFSGTEPDTISVYISSTFRRKC